MTSPMRVIMSALIMTLIAPRIEGHNLLGLGHYACYVGSKLVFWQFALAGVLIGGLPRDQWS